MIKRNPIYRIDPDTGKIQETFRDVCDAAKAARLSPAVILRAAREGEVLRWSLWKEEEEVFCLELSNGKRMVVREVDMPMEDVNRLFEGGIAQKPRVVAARVVFPARDLQADEAWQDPGKI